MTKRDLKKCLLTILFTFYFVPGQLQSQNPADTLNKFNANKKKQGYWTFYFDSSFTFCEIEKAKYRGFYYYEDGSTKHDPIQKLGKRDSIVYRAFPDSLNNEQPTLLNGEVFHYNVWETSRPHIYEVYRNGRQSELIEYSARDQPVPDSESYYFDSLYNNNPATCLYYFKINGLSLYKQYIGKGLKTERIYFIEHKEFKSRNKLKLGYNWTIGNNKPENVKRFREFAEIGYSKNFVKGFRHEETGERYTDNLGNFHAISISLLGSTDRRDFRFGQKITWSRVLFLVKVEAGIVNYTDFKKHDPGIIFGAGLTAFGLINDMIYFTVPLTKTPFTDIGRFTWSITLN